MAFGLLTGGLLSCLALASCNQGPSVHLTNASGADVANAVAAAGADAALLHAGKWETRTEVVDFTMPGMDRLPPQFAAQMKARMAQGTTVSACMTADQAKKPDAAVLSGRTGNKCTFDHYTMADGRIDAQMSCNEPSGTMTMTMTGTYTGDSVDEQAEMTATGASGAMHSKMHVTSRRVGDCTADELGAAEAKTK